MKELAAKHGFPVAPFRRVLSPSCILEFVEEHGFPVIIKPTLGSATVGLKVLRDFDQLKHYFKHSLFLSMDLGRRMDFVGEVLIEKYLEASMVHVNGFAKRGHIEIMWPFRYINTCLDFTTGTPYGNSNITQGSSEWNAVLSYSSQLLEVFPCPDGLSFHLELFHNTQLTNNPNETPDQHNQHKNQFVLCEIAARRPGGSISGLINILESEKFYEMDFRHSVGLPLRHNRNPDIQTIIADLIIPLKKGILRSIPASCPIENVTYIPVAKEGVVYAGFDVEKLNTACRFVVIASSAEETMDLITKAQLWFDQTVLYDHN